MLSKMLPGKSERFLRSNRNDEATRCCGGKNRVGLHFSKQENYLFDGHDVLTSLVPGTQLKERKKSLMISA